ncbi:hypothetical protein D3C81_1086160 [compost metagenome]
MGDAVQRRLADLRLAGVDHLGGVLLQQQAVAQILLHRVEGGDGLATLVAGAQFFQQGVGADAVTDAQLVLGDQVLEALDLLVQRAGGDDAHQVGNLHRVVGALLLLVGQAEQGEGGRRRLGLPLGLDGRQLGLLHVADLVARLVAEDDHREDRGHAEGRGDGEGAAGEAQIALLQQVVAGNRQDEHRAGDVAGRHGMHELDLRHRIEQQRAEVDQLHAHGLVVELGAHRVLHPAVGDQDPQRRQVGAQRHQPGHRQVLHLAQAIPAEEEQADEGRLEEERHQALDGQRRAEDVADVVAVVGPVGAELELHGQPGGDAEGEVDAEQLAPELDHVLVDLFAGHHVDRLHDRQQEGQAERQGHEQEVVHRGHGELQTRQVDDGFRDHLGSSSFRDKGCCGGVPSRWAPTRSLPFSGTVGSVNQITLMVIRMASLISRMMPISRTRGIRQGDGGVACGITKAPDLLSTVGYSGPGLIRFQQQGSRSQVLAHMQ